MKIRCAIIEDEPQARRLLEEYTEQVEYLQLIFTAPDGISGFNRLQDEDVELVYLDINLPGISGLELSERVPRSTKVIFITAYQEYALQGFENSAVDYVLKPVSFNRFLQATQKARHLIELERRVETKGKEEPYFFAKSGKKIHQLDWDRVLYIESSREYLALITETEKILVYKRMKELEEMHLPNFVRVHKSYFVNIKKIKQIENNLIKIGNATIPISSKYHDAFFVMLKGRLF